MAKVGKPPDKGTTGYYEAEELLRIPASGLNPDGTAWALPSAEAKLSPTGYRQFTNLAAAQLLSAHASGMPNASSALIQPTGANIRFTDDGTTPTATLGMQLAAGTIFFYTGDLEAFRFIQESAGGVLNVLYYA